MEYLSYFQVVNVYGCVNTDAKDNLLLPNRTAGLHPKMAAHGLSLSARNRFSAILHDNQQKRN